eukprot:4183770-Heterocapsa_arctica.AAC.1
MAKKGITIEGIKSKLCPGEDVAKEREKLKSLLQSRAAAANLAHFLDIWEHRIDKKLGRWRFPGDRHQLRNRA